MNPKPRIFLLPAALGLSVFATMATSNEVQAANMGGSNNSQGMTIQWNQQMHGNRCVTRFGNCRHFHRGFYYETAWWTLPLVIATGSFNGHHRLHDRSQHVSWCMRNYNSYNTHNDSWRTSNGDWRRCYGPF
jgi:hypothetical protein